MRKMLKEEKELRKYSNDICSRGDIPGVMQQAVLSEKITALVRAVREECATTGAEAIKNCMRSPKIEVQEKVVNVMADYVAATIREGK